jgi:glycosyltransferase involved in cell wall biosynthesis
MKLSVAMITYNQERFIGQAIESVLAQKVNFDFEIVIGEDCSTDGTRAIVMDFHRRYPDRIVPLLGDQNVGAMRNLQETLAACRGQYVALLEGDDYWIRDDKLQKQVDFFEAHPDCAICCQRAQYLDELNATDVEFFPSLPGGIYTIDDLLKGNFVMTCTAVLRREWIGTLPSWFSEMHLGDWPLFALVAQHGAICLLDDVASVYRVHAGGIWTSRSQASRLQETIRMLEAVNKELGYRYAVAIRQAIARSYLYWGEIARSNGKRVDTGMCLVNCLRYGGAYLTGSVPILRGLAWYTALGSLHSPLARAKRAILG